LAIAQPHSARNDAEQGKRTAVVELGLIGGTALRDSTIIYNGVPLILRK
jgi:hypothetical protein